MSGGAEVIYLPTDQQEALRTARYLAECGVPLFVAEPVLDRDGSWVPDGGKSKTGYHFPDGWQNSTADPRVVDRWRVGMALCAVTGHLVDGLDIDPRNGGDRSRAHLRSAGILPRSYGRARTPSGGTHELVASLGVRSRDGVLPGVDYKAGVPGEGGHGFIFIAPTVKLSKATGEVGAYSWETAPDLDLLVLVGADDTGEGMRALLAERTRPTYEGPSYSGRGYADLNPAERSWADREVDAVVEFWRQMMAEAAGWPEGERDGQGRGWEALARDCAWALARVCATPWTRLDEDEARALYSEVLGAEVAALYADKWDSGLVGKASEQPCEPPPWDGLGVLRNQERIVASNEAVAAEWLRNEIGMPGTPLAGLFRRGEEVVHTPRIDEDGYVALTTAEGDTDGPAQVRQAGVPRIQARVQFSYRVVRAYKSRGTTEPMLFPGSAVSVVLGDVHLAPNLRPLAGVTHTPMLRRDGSVLDRVGYDDASARLFLPEPGLVIARVADVPTDSDVERARELLLSMVEDFPFNTVHDRANYLALALTPLMREMLPPPYKLGAINAHQRGSGKSLLAWILRTLHGGALRGDVPKDGEEMRKQITALLRTTTAAVVQFDNVRHLEATQLDALLTSDTWSDRVLGASADVTVRNDRLWVATGNNITLGGDLVRRVLWVSIDPQRPDPEARTDFHITDLKGWVRGRRGELLGALLTLLRRWVVDGRPTGERVGEDDYARWIEALRGVLAAAEIEGVVGHPDTVRQRDSNNDDQWATFLEWLWGVFGSEEWTAAQVVAQVAFDEVPEGMKVGSAVSVGKWLANHEGQWAGGYCVRRVGAVDNTKQWRVVRYGE